MKIDNKDLHSILKANGVLHLFHANTVASSISFILAGGLLSRGDIERRNIYQTPQNSDTVDKEYDVWDDVFLDIEDLHIKFGRNNIYGPVLFKFSIDFLLSDDLDIWITKDNPIYWQPSSSPGTRYFSDASEYSASWDARDSQKRMITIRKPYSPILFPFLKEIVIDDTAGEIYEGHGFKGVNASTIAAHALMSATETHRSLRQLMRIRECDARCYCAKNYSESFSDTDLARLFLPRGLIYSG